MIAEQNGAVGGGDDLVGGLVQLVHWIKESLPDDGMQYTCCSLIVSI